MFKKARTKLTAWYVLIIMSISMAFSGFIYVRTCHEFERGFKRIEIRHKAEELGIPLPRFFPSEIKDLPLRLREIPFKSFFIEDLREAKKRLGLNLLAVNGAILVFSSFAGYFLAGRTLRPIENTLEEQKKFVADASHELRTPLTALKTLMEVALRDKKMTLADAKKVLEDNLEEVENLKSLSDKLLSLTRYQTNGQSLVFGEVDIGAVAEKAAKKISPLAKEKEIELKTELKSKKLWANEESLEEMLLIFLDNAVKYTPRGGKVIVQGEINKKVYVIKVKDTGIGIAKEDLPHIFDRFYRADQSRSKEHLRGGNPPAGGHDSSDGGKISGFGLGLSLAKEIIEIHKGSVSLTSALGKGTTFTIKLPLKHT